MSDKKVSCTLGVQLATHSYSSQDLRNEKPKKSENNVVGYVVSRVIEDRVDVRRRSAVNLTKRFDTSHMVTNNLLQERTVKCDSFESVLSSQWLDNRNVIFGTECNKLNVVNVCNRQIKSIETLKKSSSSNTCEIRGIKTIEINASRTLLATSGHDASNVAVYRLPNLEPLCVGEITHWNHLLDLKWVDDKVLVCVNGNRIIYVLALDEDIIDYTSSSSPSSSSSKYCHIKIASPITLSYNTTAEMTNVQAIQFNGNTNELVALTEDWKMHFFDRQSLVQTNVIDLCSKFIIRIDHRLSYNIDRNLYSVASFDSISIVDGQCHRAIKHSKILGQYLCKSLTFDNNLLTIGTSSGTVLFYDIRTMDWIRTINLKSSDIIAQPEVERFGPIFNTIKYDYTNTRLFAAGGIINFQSWQSCGYYSSYISIWD